MKNKKAYVEICSFGVSTHDAWFDSLKEAKAAVEEHLNFLAGLGGFTFYLNEAADGVEMKDGDVSMTIYVPSENEEEGDNDVGYVIIRPMRGE